MNAENNITNLLQQLQIGGSNVIYEEDEHGRIPLIRASMIKDERTAQTVKRLLERHSYLDYQDFEGKTAIHYAAGMNDPEVLRTLLEYPADYMNRERVWDLPDNYGRTAIFYATPGNIEDLISAGAKPNHVDRSGMTPILYYIQHGKTESVQQLVNLRPELVSEVAPCGETALHAALFMRNYELLSGLVYIVPANEVKVRNSRGTTVMDVAIANKNYEAVNILWNSWAFSESDLEQWIGIAASCAELEWRELLTQLRRSRQLSRAQCT